MKKYSAAPQIDVRIRPQPRITATLRLPLTHTCIVPSINVKIQIVSPPHSAATRYMSYRAHIGDRQSLQRAVPLRSAATSSARRPVRLDLSCRYSARRVYAHVGGRHTYSATPNPLTALRFRSGCKRRTARNMSLCRPGAITGCTFVLLNMLHYVFCGGCQRAVARGL